MRQSLIALLIVLGCIGLYLLTNTLFQPSTLSNTPIATSQPDSTPDPTPSATPIIIGSNESNDQPAMIEDPNGKKLATLSSEMATTVSFYYPATWKLGNYYADAFMAGYDFFTPDKLMLRIIFVSPCDESCPEDLKEAFKEKSKVVSSRVLPGSQLTVNYHDDNPRYFSIENTYFTFAEEVSEAQMEEIINTIQLGSARTGN